MLRFLTKRVRHSLCFATNAMCACENCRIGLFFKVYSIHSEKKENQGDRFLILPKGIKNLSP